MAYPGDPVAKGPAGFEHAPLTPDDLEQLATAFRPSWELDDAPFTGAGTLSAADVRALQGGGTHVDVRAAMPNPGSPFPPSRPNGAQGVVEESIIVREATPPTPAVRPAPPPPAPRAEAAPAVPLEATRIVPRRASPPAAQPARMESFAEVSPFARPSRKPLWLGLGAGAVVLAGVGIWAASGSSADAPAPAPSAVASTVSHTPQTIPLPTLVAPAPMAPPVTATTLAVTTPSALPRAPAPVAVTPAPSPVPATPHYVAASPAPHPAAAPQPAPKPAPHPKGGTTIVHDVPF